MSSSTAERGVKDQWQDDGVAKKYLNAENATRPYAKILVGKSGLKDGEESYVLDLACGTGAVVQEIYDAVPREKWDGVRVYGGDVSQGMLDYLTSRGSSNGWTGLTTGVVDGNDIKFEDATFTHALCTFGVFMMPKSLSELFRVTKSRGFVGVTSWVRFQWIPLIQTSITHMSSHPYNPSASEITSRLFSNAPWNEANYIVSRMRDAGFVNVESEQKALTTGVGSAEMALESMQFPLNMIKTFWPEDTRDELVKEINPILLKEIEKMVVDGVVQMEFEGVCVWGWKP